MDRNPRNDSRQKKLTGDNRSRKWLIVFIVFILFVYNILPSIIRHIYCEHGHGDQHLTFWVVFGSFLSPLLWPLLHVKTLMFNVLLPAMNMGWIEGELTYTIGRALLTPNGDFDPLKLPPKP